MDEFSLNSMAVGQELQGWLQTCMVHVLCVPGGWVYTFNYATGNEGMLISSVFVPNMIADVKEEAPGSL